MIHYGAPRRTHNGSDRADILSRDRGPAHERYVGRIMCDFPGFRVEWVCAQDMRDLRRFRAFNLDGIGQGHGTPKELLRACIALAPCTPKATSTDRRHP